MAENIVVLDKRIGTAMRAPNDHELLVLPSEKLDAIVKRILKVADGRKIGVLSILAHGIAMPIHDDVAMMSSTQGGYGIALGHDNLRLYNVKTLHPLRGHFVSDGMIEVYACDIATISPARRGLSGNGIKLLQRMARVTGVPVRASEASQMYSPGFVTQDSSVAGVDFGAWEGKVWLFHPSGYSEADLR